MLGLTPAAATLPLFWKTAWKSDPALGVNSVE